MKFVHYFMFNTILSAFIFLGLLLSSIRTQAQCSGIDFTANKTTVCAPGFALFTASGIPQNAGISWDLGNGPQQGSSITSGIYTNPGKVTIELVVSLPSNQQCTVKKTDYLDVREQTKPAITADKNVLCNLGDSIKLTDNTPFSINRKFIVNDFELENAPKTISLPITKKGLLSVTLVVTDQFGCPPAIGFFDSVALVHEKPTVSIIPSKTSGCAPALVNFQSSILIQDQQVSGYNWSFVGASPASSTSANPNNISYNSKGSYAATLQITTNKGCQYATNAASQLSFGDSVIPVINISNTKPCRNQTIKLSNATNAALGGTYTWTHADATFVADSTINHRIIRYSTLGQKNISLTRVLNGCISQTTLNNSVNVQGPHGIYSVVTSRACLTDEIIKINSSSVLPSTGTTSYNWTFTNSLTNKVVATSTARNPRSRFNEFGSLNVRLIVSNTATGCRDTVISNNAVVIAKPTAAFTGFPFNTCPGGQATMVNQTALMSSEFPNQYFWTFYDSDKSSVLANSTLTNPSLVYNNLGAYDVKLVAFNSQGCADSITKTNFVNVTNIKANFTITDDKPCANTNFNFTQTSFPPSFNFTHNWFLQHADSTYLTYNYTGPNPTINVRLPGKYHVKYAISLPGCSDSISKNNFLNVSGLLGNATITSASACVPMSENATFNLIQNLPTKNPANNSLSYQWLSNPQTGIVFSSENLSNTNVAINTKGNFNVSVRVTNADNCFLEIPISKVLAAGVNAGFSLSDSAVCYKTPISTNNLSTLEPNLYQWSSIPPGLAFSPNSNAANPTIETNDSGRFEIILVSSKNNQCFDTAKSQILVSRVKADFYSEDTMRFCAPTQVKFISKSVNADTSYWNFGDGTIRSSNRDSLTHIYYFNSGTNKYSVYLNVIGGLNCKDSLKRENYISVVGPVADFEFPKSSGCEDLTVNFTDKSQSYSNYYFDFGDGSVFDTTGNPGTHIYRVINPYLERLSFIPKLLLTDIYGCFALKVAQDSIVVFKKPKSYFLADPVQGCEPLRVEFFNQSDFAAAWAWDMDGDKRTDYTIAKPIHNFEAGNYDVSLIVTSQYGCSDTFESKNLIEAFPLPTVDFTTDRIESDTADPHYIFTDKSSNGSQVEWFLNGSSASTNNVWVANLESDRLHLIKLVVTSSNNCVDSILSEVDAVPAYFLAIPNAFSPNGDGLNDFFGPEGYSRATAFEFDIYDRWGKLVFQSKDISKKWDGKINGVQASDGFYLYKVMVKDANDNKYNYRGMIKLMR